MNWRWFKKRNKNGGDLSTLYLFPDTNFFIQYLPPRQIDWLEFSEFEEVQLLVARPVQKEIDDHKNKGGERIGKRARKAAALFKEIIHSEDDFVVVNEKSPRVTIRLRVGLRAARFPDKRLDMQEPDDKLVAIALEFSHRNIGTPVRVLTDDSGPAVSAKMMGLAVEAIPSKWRLPPESSASEKRIKSLETQVLRLTENEPKFEIDCLVDDDRVVGPINLEVSEFEPLAKDEIERLLTELQERYPLRTDFDDTKDRSRRVNFGVVENWKSAHEDEIEKYRSAYSEWIKKLTSTFSSLHLELNRREKPVSLIVQISNVGNRPGKDALVEIQARGNFSIRVPSNEEKLEDVVVFSPPKAPTGRWVNELKVLNASIEVIARQATQFGLPIMQQPHGERIFNARDLTGLVSQDIPATRDPNQFYYKDSRPIRATSTVTLECEQWRHGTSAEGFYIEIVIPKDVDRVSGALDIIVHAENLSIVVKKTFPLNASRTNLCAMSGVLSYIDQIEG